MIEFKKYIIIDGNALVFDLDLIHADMVFENSSVNSAGFVVIWETKEGLKVTCYGESTTLSISSRPEIDEKLIIQYLNLNKKN